MSTALQTSLGGNGEVALCLMAHPHATAGSPGLKIALCLLIGAVCDDSVTASEHPPAVNAVEMLKLVLLGCVHSTPPSSWGLSPSCSKDLQDWGFHPPGKSGKRHDLGRGSHSECRGCHTSCLVRSHIAKQSQERFSLLVLGYPLGCMEAAFDSLCLSVITLQWWSYAGHCHACCLTDLGTELGPRQLYKSVIL